MTFPFRFVLIALGFLSPNLRADIRLAPNSEISTPRLALEAARAVEERPVRITVAEGVYPLEEALTLGPEDSQITWEADADVEVVFSGGRRITGWKRNDEGLWEVTLPRVRDSDWNFDQLWVDRKRATRARTPNRGFFHLEGKLAEDTFEGITNAGYEGFTLNEDVFSILEQIPETERKGVLLTVPHSWSVAQCRIAALDPASLSVRIRGKSRYEFLAKGPSQRLWIEGFRAALDAPGEWHLDRDSGKLFYFPREGEDPGTCEVIAPVAPQFLKLDGATEVTFRGIRFLHSQYLYPDDGLHDGQAAVLIGGSVEVENSREIHFDRCDFGHLGTYAIYFKENAHHCSVTGGHLFDLGAGGVRIGSTKRPGEGKLCHHIRIDNCIIQQGGRMHPSACGVVLTHATDCAVSHCDIGDFYYTGVSFGWNWGYGESLSRRNRLENCRIHHIGWAYLGDMGGFYNLGNAPETVVRGNHIHHVASYDYGGWGLYTDEGSGDVLMENNLVHDTSSAGFHQHYGYANRIRNNIFAFGEEAQVRRSRRESHLTITFENNIVVWDPGSPLFRGPVSRWEKSSEREKGDPADSVLFRRNLYWQSNGEVPARLTEEEDPDKGLTWKQWQEWGRDRESRFADPRFQDLAARDFRLQAESPAFELGFVAWNLDESGVRGDGPRGGEWREVAARAHEDHRWETEAVPWPKPRYRIEEETFERIGSGSLGIKAGSWVPQETAASVGVVEGIQSPILLEKRTGGKKALRVLDAPGLEPAYHPILHVRPDWGAGTFRAKFDVMSEPGAVWFFEMRGAAEFGAGPYVRWQEGKLTAGVSGSIPLADVAAGEWIRLEILATTGRGTWTIHLFRADGTEETFTEIPCKPEWTDAGYLLWSGIGQEKAAFFLDNLSLIEEDRAP